MRKVYTSSDLNLVQYARSVLEGHKIESVILREQLAGVVGGIAPLDAWTELWVHDAARTDEARQLIDSAMKITETQQQPWHCPCCGENIEAQFAQCWKCETERKY